MIELYDRNLHVHYYIYYYLKYYIIDQAEES